MTYHFTTKEEQDLIWSAEEAAHFCLACACYGHFEGNCPLIRREVADDRRRKQFWIAGILFFGSIITLIVWWVR